MKSIKQQLITTGYALLVSGFIGKWAINYAYLERGYQAMGGEYIFIFITYLIAHKVMNNFINILKEAKICKQQEK